MKKIIANIKMGQTPSETKKYLMTLASKFDDEIKELTICLPYTSLACGQYLLSNTNIAIGAQNLSDEEKGSYTGEISGAMLKDSGVKRVIIGHSERRSKFKETNKLINKKIKIALKNRLEVILCVGENLIDKNTMKTLDVITVQIEECLKGLYENELENITIAYEPVWAIGTGKSATIKEIEASVSAIRKAVAHSFSQKAGDEMSIVYGGSINVKNIVSIIKANGLYCVLIGGSSLDVQNLLYMISLC